MMKMLNQVLKVILKIRKVDSSGSSSWLSNIEIHGGAFNCAWDFVLQPTLKLELFGKQCGFSIFWRTFICFDLNVFACEVRSGARLLGDCQCPLLSWLEV